MKQSFLFFVFCIILALNACQPETELVQTPQHDTTTVTSSEISPGHTGNAPVELVPRAGGTWNINMSGFKHVYQNRLPLEWDKSSKYNTSGKCLYPVYTGSSTTKIYSQNLCGLASFLMCLSLVPHDSYVDVPSDTNAIAKRLVELMKRYQAYDPAYVLGDITAIASLKNIANGTSIFKGEFTNWLKCDEKKWVSTEFNVQQPDTNGVKLMKDFIRIHIQNDHPVLALVSINTKIKDPQQKGYFTKYGGIGHMVVITGITENDNSKIYKVRFRDPLYKDSKQYEANYLEFLDSMIDFPNYYNALAFAGK